MVADPASVVVTPASQRSAAIAEMQLSRQLVGADLMVLTEAFGIERPILLEAIRGYVEDPASRASLSS